MVPQWSSQTVVYNLRLAIEAHGTRVDGMINHGMVLMSTKKNVISTEKKMTLHLARNCPGTRQKFEYALVKDDFALGQENK